MCAVLGAQWPPEASPEQSLQVAILLAYLLRQTCAHPGVQLGAIRLLCTLLQGSTAQLAATVFQGREALQPMVGLLDSVLPKQREQAMECAECW